MFAFKTYNIGDTFTIHGSTYFVIADSDKNQDYVVALKEKPLTVSEVNTYGGGYVNRYTSTSSGQAINHNGYGGVTFYTNENCRYNGNNNISTGCNNNYNDSDIKHIVNNWSSSVFEPGELKEVDHYQARLITFDEYNNIPSSNTWRYNSQYCYWSMTAGRTQQTYPERVYAVPNNNGPITDIVVWAQSGEWVVRPVINIYKSTIE